MYRFYGSPIQHIHKELVFPRRDEFDNRLGFLFSFLLDLFFGFDRIERDEFFPFGLKEGVGLLIRNKSGGDPR